MNINNRDINNRDIKNDKHPGSPEIRKFTPGDYEAVAALWREAGLPLKPIGRDKKENILNEVISNH